MLTDDLTGEQYIIQKAFYGVIDGEIEVTHLFCKVYTLQIIHTKLSGPLNIEI